MIAAMNNLLSSRKLGSANFSSDEASWWRSIQRRDGGDGGGHSDSDGESSSPGRAKGASASFLDSMAGHSFSIFDGKYSATAYSDGGGKSVILGSESTFPGRQAGGGTRVSSYLCKLD